MTWKTNRLRIRLTNVGIWETTKNKQVEQYGWRTLESEKQWKANRLTVVGIWETMIWKTEKLHSTVYRRWNMKSKEVAHTADERWNMRNRLNSTVGGGWNINNEKQTGCTVRLTEVGIWATGWTVRLTAVGIWETITWKTNRLHSTVYGCWNMRNIKNKNRLNSTVYGRWNMRNNKKKKKKVKQYGVWTLEYEKQ